QSLGRLAQQSQSTGFLRSTRRMVVYEFFQGVAQTVPRRQEVARLRPGKDPGDRPQVAQVVRTETPAGPGAEPQAFNQVDRCSLIEVLGKVGSLISELAVESAAALG